MQQSTEKLYKIFKLEAELGFTNKAVVGGLEKLTESWIGEARAESVEEEIIQKVSNILSQYPDQPAVIREKSIKTIGEILDNPGIKSLKAINKPSPSADNIVSEVNSDDQEKSHTTIQKRNTPDNFSSDLTENGLRSPLTSVRGIGQRQAQLLEKLGLFTIEDIIYYFPRRYDDYSELKLIKDLKFGEEVTIVGWVKSINAFTTRNKNKKIIQAVLSDDTGSIQLLWFNQEFQLRYLRKNMFLSVSGKIEQYMGRLVIYHPDYEELDKQSLNTQRIVPIYSLTARLSQRWLRRAIFNVVNLWAPKIPEYMTEYILADANLMDLPSALTEIHFPDDISSLKKARYRLAFDEIFLLQLGVLRQKYDWALQKAERYPVDDQWLLDNIKHLPFDLTNAQMRVLTHIREDLESGRPMNRLLQGDVGSGKTVVGALAIAMVIKQDAQAAFMAPTSILAEQHFRSLTKLLADPELKQSAMKESQIHLLIGDTPAKEREEILAGLSDGSVKLVIGTHALIEDPVKFKNLQIAIVDEQHRFGVTQRAALREKGKNPHLLIMTATPIPRSLALTIYGDLDVSVMDEMPANRQPVSTHILYPTERERAYSLIRSHVESGHQAFIIYPLVEQGEREDTLAAVEEHNRLQTKVFKDLKLGLVHGRLKPDEKETVMRKFRDKEFDILVSTSVIEVGVDFPNATVMVIEGANRFGLAQLHQFRGRVGRGADKAFCLLIPETNDAAENERLLAMERTNDGFVLAEYDLNQRGPGEFLGTRQSGYTNLRLANLTDIHLIEKARKYAKQVFENDPNLSAPEHQLMLDAMKHFWPSAEEGERS